MLHKASAVQPVDTAARSILESGIRGSLGVALVSLAHINLGAWQWDAHDVLLAAYVATPVLLLEAALLLPNFYSATTKASHLVDDPILSSVPSPLPAPSRSMPLAAPFAALHKGQEWAIQQHVQSQITPGAAHVGLRAVGQLSEEVLARGALLAVMANWIASRMSEAGVEHTALGSTQTTAQVVAAVVISVVVAARYRHHSQRAAQDIHHSTHEHKRQIRLQKLGFAPPSTASAFPPAALDDATLAEHEQQLRRQSGLYYTILGGQFVARQASLNIIYILTGSLGASFLAGLSLQLLSDFWSAQKHRAQLPAPAAAEQADAGQ